jgi:hypothetical protein
VVLTIVAAETVIWDTVAVVTATLLPSAVLGLPAPRAIVLPGNLLLVRLRWIPLLCRPVVRLLTLLSLLFLLRPGLLLPLRRVVLALLLLSSLLFLLPLSDLLLVSCGLVLLTLSLFLLLLLGLLLFLFRRVVSLLVLLFLGLRLLALSRGVFFLLSLGSSLSLRFPGLGLLFLLVLPCVGRKTDPEQQKKRGCLDDSNSFHGVAPLHLLLRPSLVMKIVSTASPVLCAECHVRNLASMLVTRREFAKENERFRIHSGATTQRRSRQLR